MDEANTLWQRGRRLCLACQYERGKDWAANNREHINESMREWRKKNSARVNAQRRAKRREQ
jgi:hypothetical protein